MRHKSQHNDDNAIWALGCLFVLKGASPELEVIEALAPAGYSPPRHQHDFGTESFYVIEGSMRFVVGDSDAVYGPGDLAHVPRSTPHSFETLEPIRVLNMSAPAGLWAFFNECGEPAGELRLPDEIQIPSDLPDIVARHGGQVLGPPLNRPALAIDA
jgi:quercetin dioxygenase-like cupin family protein